MTTVCIDLCIGYACMRTSVCMLVFMYSDCYYHICLCLRAHVKKKKLQLFKIRFNRAR